MKAETLSCCPHLWTHMPLHPRSLRSPGVRCAVLATQVLALDESGVKRYLEYCRTHAFAGQPTLPTLDDLQRLLSGWYEVGAAEREAEHAATAASGCLLPPRVDVPLVDNCAEGHEEPDPVAYSLTFSSRSNVAAARLEPALAALTLSLATHSPLLPHHLLDIATPHED